MALLSSGNRFIAAHYIGSNQINLCHLMHILAKWQKGMAGVGQHAKNNYEIFTDVVMQKLSEVKVVSIM